MGVLSSELRGWVVPGLAGVIAVVDSRGLPRIARVWAARVLDGSDVIEIYVQRAGALPLLEALVYDLFNLESGRRAALNLIEVTTYRSRMFKGACALAPNDPDPTFVDESLAADGRAFHSVGMPADAVERILSHGDPPREMVALRLTVEAIFDQSPKPGAGARL
jgi:hypothetical protein